MGMTKCSECGTPISTKAETCPKCGAKIKRTSRVVKLIAILIALGIVASIWASLSAERRAQEKASVESVRLATLTVEQRTTEEKAKADAKAKADKDKADRESKFQKAFLLATAVKKSANDPKSIEFFEAFATDDGTVALRYRGKNAYGGTVVNSAILTKDGKTISGPQDKVAATWNKYVAKKPGTDLSSSISVLNSLAQ